MNKKQFNMLILVLISIITIFVAILVGTVNIKLEDIGKVIIYKFSGVSLGTVEQPIEDILWKIRIPRVLLAFLVGASLASSGAIVQSVLKNPLASPYTLGVSSGASLGVVIIIVTGIHIPMFGIFFQTFIGFVFAVTSVYIVIKFTSLVDKNMYSNNIVLAGMVFSLFYNSIQNFIITMHQDHIKQIIVWQLGSVSMKGWSYVYALLLFALIGFSCVMFFIKELDLLTLGEEQAKSIGVNTGVSIKVLIMLSAVLSGAAVSVCGTIGFIDLITPHIARRIFGSKHIYIIPSTILIGGTIMVITDLVARTLISPVEIPVGTVIALIGSPFFIYIYFKGRRDKT